MATRATLLAVLLSTAFVCAACSSTGPSKGATATIRVIDEEFRVALIDEIQIAAARAAQAGGPAGIPNGRIVPGASVNVGWSWHLEEVEFAELTIELCDGKPSDVERDGVRFGGGRFCPWSARVISVEGP